MSIPRDCLFPGYVNVECFEPNEEYEEYEETTYVMLDIGAVDPTLLPSSSTYRLIVRASSLRLTSVSRSSSITDRYLQGLDSSTPFLQLSGTIFKGEHNTLLGSELLFMDANGKHLIQSFFAT
jgi:general transcription factor 3C polypeptide 6